MRPNVLKRALAAALSALCMAAYAPAGSVFLTTAEDDSGQTGTIDPGNGETDIGIANTIITSSQLDIALVSGGSYKLIGNTVVKGESEDDCANIFGATCTLDLNGFTLTFDKTHLQVTEGAHLNICDSSSAGTGKMISNNAVPPNPTTMYDLVKIKDASVILESGTVEYPDGVGFYVTGSGSLTVNGGAVIGSVSIYNEGNSTVSGGAVSGSRSSIYNKGNITVSGGTVRGSVSIFNNGDITVSGGTVTGDITNNGSATVSGGIFSIDPTAYLAENHAAVILSSGKYTVIKTALADGNYKQTAQDENGFYTRFVFVVPKSEIKGKNKAVFTAHYQGNDYTYESTSYYTSMISNGIRYKPESGDSVLLTVTVTASSDISAALTCDLSICQ